MTEVAPEVPDLPPELQTLTNVTPVQRRLIRQALTKTAAQLGTETRRRMVAVLGAKLAKVNEYLVANGMDPITADKATQASVVDAAVRSGVVKGKSIGLAKSIAQAARLVFADARDRALRMRTPGKYDAFLRNMTTTLKLIDDRLAGVTDAAQRKEIIYAGLKMAIPAETYHALHVAFGDSFATGLDAIRRESQAANSRLYAHQVTDLLRKGQALGRKMYFESVPKWQALLATLPKEVPELAERIEKEDGKLREMQRQRSGVTGKLGVTPPAKINAQAILVEQLRNRLNILLSGLQATNLKDVHDTLADILAESDTGIYNTRTGVKEAEGQTAQAVVGELAAVPEDTRLKEFSGAHNRRLAHGGLATGIVNQSGRVDLLTGTSAPTETRRVLHEDVTAGDEAWRDLTNRTLTKVDDWMKAQGITPADIQKWAQLRKKRTVGTETVEMTDADLMDLYAFMQDPDNLRQLASPIAPSQFKGYRGEGMQFTPRDLNHGIEIATALTDMLTPQQKALALYMFETSQDLHDHINATSRALFGIDKAVPLHWSRERDMIDQRGDRRDMTDPSTGRVVRMFALESNPLMSDRQDNKNRLIVRSIFSRFYDSTVFGARWAKLTIPIHNAATLLDDADVKTSIHNRWGEDMRRNMLNMLAKEAGARADRSQATGVASRVTRGIQRNFAVARLAWRASSAFVNRVGGAIYVLPDLMRRDPQVARRFASLHKALFTPGPLFWQSAANREARDALHADGYLVDRWHQHTVETYANLARDAASYTPWSVGAKSAWGRLQDASLRYLANGEMKTAVLLYRAARAAGYTQESAVRLASRMTRATQNPSTPLEDSALYTWTKDNTYGQMLFPLSGQMSVNATRTISGLVDLRHAVAAKDPEELRRSAAKLAGVMLAYMVTAALAVAVRSAFRRKREIGNMAVDFAMDIMDSTLPPSGRVVTWAEGWRRKGDVRDQTLVGGILNQMVWAYRALTTSKDAMGEMDMNRLTDGILNAVDGAGALVGAPVGGPIQIARGIATHAVPRSEYRAAQDTRSAAVGKAVAGLPKAPGIGDIEQAWRAAFAEVRYAGGLQTHRPDGTNIPISQQMAAFRSSFYSQVGRRYGEAFEKQHRKRMNLLR